MPLNEVDVLDRGPPVLPNPACLVASQAPQTRFVMEPLAKCELGTIPSPSISTCLMLFVFQT